MKLRHRRRAGAWTLVELLVVVIVLLGIACLFLRALSSEKRMADVVHCVNNLGEIGKPFRLWAGDHNSNFPFRVPVTNGGTMELIPSGRAFVHFQVLSNDLTSSAVLVCPTDANQGKRVAATNFAVGFSDENVSYFVGLDAAVDKPDAWLAGDRRLMLRGRPVAQGVFSLTTNATVGWAKDLHNQGGNVLLVDGSVHQLSRAGLVHAVQLQSLATNRLAIP